MSVFASIARPRKNKTEPKREWTLYYDKFFCVSYVQEGGTKKALINAENADMAARFISSLYGDRAIPYLTQEFEVPPSTDEILATNYDWTFLPVPYGDHSNSSGRTGMPREIAQFLVREAAKKPNRTKMRLTRANLSPA